MCLHSECWTRYSLLLLRVILIGEFFHNFDTFSRNFSIFHIFLILKYNKRVFFAHHGEVHE